MIKPKKPDLYSFFSKASKSISISEERIHVLNTIAKTIAQEYRTGSTLHLNFICTHNSRRSQMAQVWAFFAIDYFNLKHIYSFSGGTAVTSFHRNTVKTLQKTGFIFNIVEFSHENPRYLISFENVRTPLLGYSKLFDDQANGHPYFAITTCDSADDNCPYLPDAIQRFHLPYKDPKNYDNTPIQDEKYLETNQHIASEMHYIFKKVALDLPH